jgi:hypothetical protein
MDGQGRSSGTFLSYIASNGAIEVRLLATNVVDFTKSGADGKGVWG